MEQEERSDPGGEDVRQVDAPVRNARPAPWLIGLATVLAVVSVFSTWVRAQALDTDTWVDTSEELLEQEEVRTVLATYLVDVLYEQLDVAAQLEEQLPDDLEGLSGPLAGALRGPATAGVERLIASDEFGALWAGVNREAHDRLVRVLRDETREGVSTADGTVTLELGQIVRRVGERLGLSDSVLDRLPEDAGRVTVFESDTLADVQAGVQVLDFLSWFSFVVVVGLYAMAVYVTTVGRLRTLRNVGLSLIGAGVFVLLIRSIGVRIGVDALVEDPGTRPVASIVAAVATRLVHQMAWSGIFYGVLIAGFATLLGRRSWAASTRRWCAPALNASPAAVAAGTTLVLVLLLWWSPGRAFEGWATGITLILLVIGAVIALRRSTRREFGDVTFDELMADLRGPGRDAGPPPVA